MKRNGISSKVIRLTREYFGPKRFLYYLFLFLFALYNFISAFLLSNMLKSVSSMIGMPFSQILWKVIFFALIYFLSAVYFSAVRLLKARAEQTLYTDMQIKLFRHYLKLPSEYYDGHAEADRYTVVSKDIQSLKNLMENGYMTFVSRLALTLGSLVMMFLWDPRLTLIYLSVALPGAVLTVLFRKRAEKYAQIALEKKILQNGLLLDIIKGMRVIRSFSLADLFVNRLEKSDRSLKKAESDSGRIELARGIIECLVSDLSFGLMLTVGMVFVSRGLSDAPTVLAFAMLVQGYSWALLGLSGVALVQAEAAPSVGRLYNLTMEKEEENVSHGDAEAPSAIRELKADAVSYYYREKAGLAPCSFQARRGEPLIVTGETGSGKSTVVKLLMRFYAPQSGRIEADGTDISRFSLASWRERISYISQDCELLPGTISSNIAPGEKEPDKARVEKAARLAGIHEKILSLENGYSCVIEAGKPLPLSGGERQRIALARVYYRDTPIVVMDEPSAMLDPAGEAAFRDVAERLSADRICVIVSHRGNTAYANGKVVRVSIYYTGSKGC